METSIKIIAQYCDNATGRILEEKILRQDQVTKPGYLKDLGYLHVEQMDLLDKLQDFKINKQIKLVNNSKTCHKCGSKTSKHGIYDSHFHGIFSDHKIKIQRLKCSGGCNLPYKLEGIFGSSTHPELLKKQAELIAEKSYVKASKELDYDSPKKRTINNRTHLSRVAKVVGSNMEEIRTQELSVKLSGSKRLISTSDGGHIKARGDSRSFEAMVASVYKPESIKRIDKNHQIITQKRIVASAKADEQTSIQKQYLNACIEEGLGNNTEVTHLADGAVNCWSVTQLVQPHCSKIIEILDWFHIGKMFKNMQSACKDTVENKEISSNELGENTKNTVQTLENIESKDSSAKATLEADKGGKIIDSEKEPDSEYDKAKWHLWHGNVTKALGKLELLINKAKENSPKLKLNKLKKYIVNNKDKIVNYQKRRTDGLVYTSNYAESTVSNLINARQKNKQRMTWTRDGSHQILQLRASHISQKWSEDWKHIEEKMYKKAA